MALYTRWLSAEKKSAEFVKTSALLPIDYSRIGIIT